MNARQILTVFLLVPLLASSSFAEWPTYRGNAARTGFVQDKLPDQLSLQWVYRSPFPPQPAWPRSERMPFDRALQTVVGNETVFFGGSSDGAVHALSLDTGETRWSFYSESPIRFAPVLWRDRLLVASDDGHLYALSAADGELLWKHRGGPNHHFILGNERLISKWPARGGPTVVDDVVYYAAGIWPSERIYLYALDPASGDELWRNDDSGGLYMPQPHGGANAESGVSSQGYLVASGDQLLVPTGRAVPAAFNRVTGKFNYFHLQKYGHNGGTPTMVIGDTFFNSGLSFSASSGERLASVGSGQMAATKVGLVLGGANSLATYQWYDAEKPDRKGNLVKTRALRAVTKASDVAGGAALIVVGDRIVSGGDHRVDVFDAPKRKTVASFEADGVVYGLAASDGKLLVSTDRGSIYCFGSGDTRKAATSTDQQPVSPFADNSLARQAAEEIIQQTDITSGYCLDLGCGDGALTYELAKRSKLRIYAVDDDPEMVRRARQNLIAAGVYGPRVTVHYREDLSDTGYPEYFANLIVSGRAMKEPRLLEKAGVLTEAKRLQRPFGGVICVGTPGAMDSSVRGALDGAGSWTHQYANAANTLNSDDALIKGPLSMLWFRDVAFEVPSRHGRAPAPLFHRGRLFHEGNNGIVAVDAYNGHEIWRYEIEGLLKAYDGDELMGVAGTGSNFCVSGESVYVRNGVSCLKLSASTGKLQRKFKLPPRDDGKVNVWGYIACVDGVLFGTAANQDHIVTYRYRATTGDMSKLLTESHSLFAIDAKTGKLKWHYKAKDSIRHNTVAIADGRVFLIDRPQALFDRLKRPEKKEHPTGRLICLDAESGEVVWSVNEDVYGTMLAMSEEHDVVLMSYQPTRFRLDSEVGGRMTAFRSTDGQRLWDLNAKYESRPMINDRTVYAQGGAWDLLTGESRVFDFKRSYGCGVLSGCRSAMFFRSATLGYYDLSGSRRTENYGGVRPGCWVNAIPAGGIVLVPDASAGCRCSYLNKTWFALHAKSE